MTAGRHLPRAALHVTAGFPDSKGTSMNRRRHCLPSFWVAVILWTMPFVVSATFASVVFASATENSKLLPPTRENVLRIASSLIDEVTPKLSLQEKAVLDSTFFILNSKKKIPALYNEAADELLNHCTIALSNTTAIKPVMITAARLFQDIPDNARTANMLGVVLFATGRTNEARTATGYALALQPRNELVMLNAANIYFDLGMGDEAKRLLDRIIKANPESKSAWSALATYWFSKGDQGKAVEAMIKASALGVGVIQKKADADKKLIETNTAGPGDTHPVLDAKTRAMKDLLPKTTADIIEDRFPEQAAEIRKRYLKLIESETMRMPALPMINTSGAKGWISNGTVIMKAWQKVFFDKAKQEQSSIMAMQYGIKPGDSKAVKKAKGKEAANKQIEQSLKNASDALQAMKGMPGIPESKIRQAEQKLKKARAKAGIKTPPAESEEGSATKDDTRPPAEIASDEDLQKHERSLVIPGWDSGSVFAVTNFRNYVAIRNSYEIYFREYFRDFNGKSADILKVYTDKRQQESQRHEEAMKNISDARDAEARANDGVVQNPERYQKQVEDEGLLHRKMVNVLGDDYFAQWAGLALIQYKSKMKPKLDEFWNVAALYIRNMNDPEVMKAEYVKVKQIFFMYGSFAVSAVNCGTTFTYAGNTYQEELEMESERAKAKEQAEQDKMEFERNSRFAANAIEKWIDDTFSIGISGQFLSLKLTPRKIVIEEYIAGMNFKHVYDFKTGEWSIYRSFCAKVDIGIQLGPMTAGVSARADILESYDVINTRNGQVVNAGSSFAKASAGGSLGADTLSVSGDATVTLDPAAESELSVKYNGSAGCEGTVHDKIKGGVSF